MKITINGNNNNGYKLFAYNKRTNMISMVCRNRNQISRYLLTIKYQI